MICDVESESVVIVPAGLPPYSVTMPEQTASDRVRALLKDELRARDISQRELAEKVERLTGEQWTQGRIGKVLNGDVELKVDDLDYISRAIGIFLSEAVRDRGLEFYAEMTPTELRLLSIYRRKPQPFKDAIQILHDMTPVAVTPKLDTPVQKRPKRGRPQNSELAKKRAI